MQRRLLQRHLLQHILFSFIVFIYCIHLLHPLHSFIAAFIATSLQHHCNIINWNIYCNVIYCNVIYCNIYCFHLLYCYQVYSVSPGLNPDGFMSEISQMPTQLEVGRVSNSEWVSALFVYFRMYLNFLCMNKFTYKISIHKIPKVPPTHYEITIKVNKISAASVLP